jgi:hypothetical protein
MFSTEATEGSPLQHGTVCTRLERRQLVKVFGDVWIWTADENRSL